MSGNGEQPSSLPGEAPRARRPSAAVPPGSAASLLAAAVARLRERTRCESTVAWAWGPAGEPELAAAASAGGPPALAPNAAELEAVSRLAGATALAAAGANAALRGLAARHRLDAAAPVLGPGGAMLAVLLTGAADASSARPRALALLASAAQRLALPLAAAQAERRLASLDAEVRQLDRFAGLGRIAQELAHEVRNPLVSVKTFLQLLPERLADAEFTTRFREVVAGELERALRLLGHAVDYPRPLPACDDDATVAAVIAAQAELVRPHARQRGVSLVASTPETLPPVALAEDALRQVLLNLLMNAVDATPRGGEVRVAASARAGGVEIVVTDAGPGIAPALRERVFEPFFSTRGAHHGGIGLAIARSLVEQAGGRIALREAAGGAEFVIFLPVRG